MAKAVPYNKRKDQKIQKALDDLRKALEIEDADIRINLRGGVDSRTPEAKQLTTAIKSLVEAYRLCFGVEKIQVELTL